MEEKKSKRKRGGKKGVMRGNKRWGWWGKSKK